MSHLTGFAAQSPEILLQIFIAPASQQTQLKYKLLPAIDEMKFVEFQLL
jgi:hypothetical protein